MFFSNKNATTSPNPTMTFHIQRSYGFLSLFYHFTYSILKQLKDIINMLQCYEQREQVAQKWMMKKKQQSYFKISLSAKNKYKTKYIWIVVLITKIKYVEKIQTKLFRSSLSRLAVLRPLIVWMKRYIVRKRCETIIMPS